LLFFGFSENESFIAIALSASNFVVEFVDTSSELTSNLIAFNCILLRQLLLTAVVIGRSPVLQDPITTLQ
jgi:hypothetical protein